MAWWSMFLLPQMMSEARQSQAAASSGATKPAPSTLVATPPPCPVPPEYTFSPWQQVHEDRQFQGEWVVQYLQYSRTKTDQCRSTSETESMVQGPYRLWPAVPVNRVADVSRPTGNTDGLSGSPLRSSEMPGLGTPGAVGPNPDSIVNSAVTVTTGTLPLIPPFYPGFALLAGAVVATLLLRRRSRQLEPAEGRQVGRVTRPSIPLVGARTLDSIKPGEEWVPSAVEVEWLQAFFGIKETGYGPRTQEAMAAFQREHKIEPDPKVMVGINTYKALWKEHIELVHDRWQKKAEGRRPIEMDVLPNSPLPSDLRAEMNEIDHAYSAYWEAVEGRYQAILRRDSAQVARYEKEIEGLTAAGVRLGDILVLKEKYQPFIDALYTQAEKVKSTANDGEYAKLQAMLAAIDKGDWDGITTAKASLGSRWGALWSRDASERALAEKIADDLAGHATNALAGVTASVRIGQAPVIPAAPNAMAAPTAPPAPVPTVEKSPTPTQVPSVSGMPADAASMLQWNVFQSSGVTEEQLIALIDPIKYPTLHRAMKEEGLAAAMVAADRDGNNPVNALFTLARLVHESGWGKASWFTEYHNTGAFMKGREFFRFNSFEESIKFDQQNMKRLYKDEGYVNIMTIAQRYAPLGVNDGIDASDGSLLNPWWAHDVSAQMVNFGRQVGLSPSHPVETGWAVDKHSTAQIEEIQRLVSGIFAEEGDAPRTGIWDQRTQAAIVQFQYFNKLLITGIVDHATWSLLQSGGRFHPMPAIELPGPSGTTTTLGPGYRRLPVGHHAVVGKAWEDRGKVESVAVPVDFWLTLNEKLMPPIETLQVTDHAGTRVTPVGNNPTRAHSGTDYHATTGTKVQAVADGQVVAATYNDVYGYYVVIEHHDALGTPFYSLYAHLSDIAPAEEALAAGGDVHRGQALGLSGGTPNYAPHLHFELFKAYGPAPGSTDAVPSWMCADHWKVYASSEAFFEVR